MCAVHGQSSNNTRPEARRGKSQGYTWNATSGGEAGTAKAPGNGEVLWSVHSQWTVHHRTNEPAAEARCRVDIAARARQSPGQHQVGFASAPVLRYYDLDSHWTLQVDGSQNGLVACLLKDEQPVHCPSRTLRHRLEVRPNREGAASHLLHCQEIPSVHTYMASKSMYRQAVNLLKPSSGSHSPRLQLVQLKPQCYDRHVAYTAGKLIYVADTLSRAYLRCDRRDDDVAEDRGHGPGTHNWHPSECWQERTDTGSSNRGHQLRQLTQAAMTGWPWHKHRTPDILQQYWLIKDQIHVADGLLCVQDRIIVPKVLQTTMLALLHESHMGVEETKVRARNALYWPNMVEAIGNLAADFAICLQHRNAQQCEALKQHPIPDRPR